MRTTTFLVAVILSASGLAAAQEADEYVNTKDGFKIYFPAQPTVKDTTWTSQQDFKLPARVYSVDKGKEHYSVTVVGSRTYAYVGMHEMKLYIAEATVPKGSAPATLFQTSFTWVDKDGNGIRYQTMYNNEFHGLRQYPVPPHTTGVGGAQ